MAPAKASTTPSDPVAGVLDTLALAATDYGLSLPNLLAKGDMLIHGTTHAINAIITGNTLDNVFILPRHAVRRGNEVALSITENDRTVWQRKDIIILWRDEKVIVTRSLKAGDVVITSPVPYATNGQELRVHVAGEAPPPKKQKRNGQKNPALNPNGGGS